MIESCNNLKSLNKNAVYESGGSTNLQPQMDMDKSTEASSILVVVPPNGRERVPTLFGTAQQLAVTQMRGAFRKKKE